MWQLNVTSILDWILEQKEDIREKLVKSDSSVALSYSNLLTTLVL